MLRDSPARSLSNPYEEALHTFCKQMLKSRLFKGFYKERCYVDTVGGYRDLVVLNRNEKELKMVIDDIRNKLVQFYQTQPSPTWVGLTATPNSLPSLPADTCIWTEFDELAFDQYWFSIKAIRFRENEVIVKLKPVRKVELEPEAPSVVRLADGLLKQPVSIGLQDFINIVLGWGISIKHTAYEFMSNDISKDNIKALLKFFSLIAISLFSALVQLIRFIGIFIIRFMIEFRRLLVVTTPILMRIIDLCSKVVGGFYILIAMIWRDATGGDKRPNNQQKAIAYNQPIYQRIKYEKKSPQTY